MANEPKGVYASIVAVMATLAKAGIGKDRKNEQQGYKFRGIDDVYNALSSALTTAALVILPKFSERTVAERTSAKGAALFYVTVSGEFTLVCALDGSSHTVGPFYGEAMDSGDKATNKAMSAAYKYMAMEVFCIPTEGDNDADSTTHEVKAAPRGSARETLTDAMNGLEPVDQAAVRMWAERCVEIYAKQGIGEVCAYLRELNLEAEKKMALWSLLDSAMRSSIKREEERVRALPDTIAA